VENSCSWWHDMGHLLLVISRVVQLLRAVAVVKRSQHADQRRLANTKSPEESSVMVASLPLYETTVSLTRHAEDKRRSLPSPPG